ncbi:c-type cytochrome [Vogesella sp. LIG4]|uniref:c-type cytochrome n=1 Tax=Vogesella sp. LIG4 TaxID=1192162 RepID=UPI00081FD898|nr:c-type cytochrome [Vogesella sp. LIG4]SCK05160.1 cytochrome c [Vogesella sp. LIG4]
MFKIMQLALAAALLLPAIARAEPSAAETLAKKSGCFACHSVQRKIIGPAYIDVADRYDGEKGAVDKLVRKVKDGGSGVWGPAGMPPHPQLKDEDIRTIVTWVLGLK